MQSLDQVAPAFVAMAHHIVWCSAATVDGRGRPRSRVLHPLWLWDGTALSGWVATGATPVKRAHLAAHPYISLNYWHPNQDTCAAECHAVLLTDDDSRQRVWDLFKQAPAPVGYDPAIVPAWRDGPLSPGFAALKLTPWRLRVFPGSVLYGKGGNILNWRSGDDASGDDASD